MTRNQIIHNLFTGKNFNDCINKMEPEHLRDDLKQEVILIVCEIPEYKILKLFSDKVLDFYIVRIILNQMHSKNSPFSKKYREEYISPNDPVIGSKQIDTIKNICYDEIDITERVEKEKEEEQCIKEIDNLHWYNKGLIELYMVHGNFRAIEKETGIPFPSAYKTIQKSFRDIKQKMDYVKLNPVK